jgi:glucokinase
MAKILGWDVGGTKCAAVVGTASGTIIERIEWPTASTPGPELMIAKFFACADIFEEKHAPFAGIGISMGGPLNMRTGVILSPPHHPGWHNIPLKQIVTNKLSHKLERGENSPVIVMHDAAACLAAEYLWGAAKGATHAIYLTCATGCGSGIMIDRKILMGPQGESPEVGYAQLADAGPEMGFCGVARKAHTEIYGSGNGIQRLAHYMFPEEFPTLIECKEISARSQRGDPAAQSVLDESARRVGQLCVTLGCIFSPQVILIGSLARYLDPRWLGNIISNFKQHALAANSQHTIIRATELGAQLQDLSSIAPVVMNEGA